MKVVVVNDCAYCMEDMLPFLQQQAEIRFLRRSRGAVDKTLGQSWRVLRSCGDVFHVNYGLQDAWFTRWLKRLDVLWLHGSDVRGALLTRRFGWMVRGNIAKAKRVFVSTDDLTPLVKSFRGEVEVLERPVRTDLFMPKKEFHNPLRAVYFPKMYDRLPPLLPMLLSRKNVSLTIVERHVPYSKMPQFLCNFDVFVDQTTIPAYSKTCLEAMSCGLTAFTYKDRCNLVNRVNRIVENFEVESRRNREYVVANHDAAKVASKLLSIWWGVLEET